MRDLKLASLFLVLAVFSAAGCSATNKSAKKTGKTTDKIEVAEAEGPGKPSSVSEVNIRGAEFGATPGLAAIQFDYDRYALTELARKTLAKNAAFLKKNSTFEVLVEGHCDERGTIEYNLALGQKRAQTVREYYSKLGVPEKQIGTISYGKEKPSCPESNEECWAKNRRAETKVRSRTVSNHHAHPGEEEPPK